jgi:hypothetical protein
MSRLLRLIAFLACLAAVPAHAQYGPEYPVGDDTSYTALWWVPAESGWGLNTNHQGDIVFATLFTYAPDGQPMWLVGPSLNGIPGEKYFTGLLYRTTGPAFNQVPWSAIGSTVVGSMSIEFYTSALAMVSYTFNGTTVSKTVERQVFSAGVPECTKEESSRAGVANYQDLWWNPAESGWGINMVQQGTIIFATLFTYAPSGRDLWVVGPALHRQLDGTYEGALYTTSGTTFDASPWIPVSVAEVGTMNIRFTAGNRATLTYTLNGVQVVKSIERQVFAAAAPACR